MHVNRRQLLAGAAVTAVGAAAGATLTTVGAPTASAAPGSAGPADSVDYLVGCGIADMTGAVAGEGMMGYSDSEQVSEGLLQRCWSRAYIVVDQATGERVVFVTSDIACLFQSHHMGLMTKLRKRFGSLYTERNVNLNATHTHASCGGTAWDFAYSLAAYGFKKKSYDAEVEGIFRAIVRAHENLAPGSIRLGRGSLENASANRSTIAFDRNPASDRRHFPDAIDPAVTVLRFSQGGNDVGALTWFSTHGTSLTDANTYIAGDNKGYASYLWEQSEPGIVAAFPQTNSGDMTPNLNLTKMNPSGPTEDHKRNCEIIGRRQFDAGRAVFAGAGAMTRGGVDSVIRYIDISAIRVSGDYTPNGRPAATTPAMMGAAGAATSTEDNNRSQLGFLKEGVHNPLVDAFGGTAHAPISPFDRDMQAPKLIAFPLGLLPPSGWVPSVVPIQLLRIGQLVLVALPTEVTIVAGLRLRQIVADAMKVSLDDVLIQGYSNAYTQYVTTPEEYDSQQYEGGETLFGRYTLPAYMQEFHKLAADFRAGRTPSRGPAPLDKSGFQPDLLPPVPADRPMAGRRYGDVVRAPKSSYRAGQTVSVSFVGAHPNNDLRHEDSYLKVERHDGSGWVAVADDNDWSTLMRWARPAGSSDASVITVDWKVPEGITGRHRIRYFGDAKAADGRLHPISGTSTVFAVR